MPTEIVIVGGGVIGLCTALSVLESPDRPPDSRVTLIETLAVALGASGRSAGFIAGNSVWHRPATVDLGRLSLVQWDKLVEKFNGTQSFGYRNIKVSSLLVGTGKEDTPGVYGVDGVRTSRTASEPWHNGELIDMGPASDSALILPNLFCSRVYQHCTQLGLRTIITTPTGRTDKVIHTSSGQDIPYDVLAITAGPWCNDVCLTLGLPEVPIAGGPGHFVQIQTGYISGGLHKLPPEAMFAGIGDTLQTASDHLAALDVELWFTKLTEPERWSGLAETLELFPREDGTVYVAGENHLSAAADALPDRKWGLPPNPRDVSAQLDQLLIKRITRTAKVISSALDVDNGARLVRAEVTFRPITVDRIPIFGELIDSVFICGGHGSWGVTLGPASGQVMSELLIASLLGKEPVLSADISQLSPRRFSPEQIKEFLHPASAPSDGKHTIDNTLLPTTYSKR